MDGLAKNCHLYSPSSKTLFKAKSKSHLLNAAHEKKSLAQEIFFHTAILLTFIIRSKRRLNKKCFHEKPNSFSSRKNKEHAPLCSSAQLKASQL